MMKLQESEEIRDAKLQIDESVRRVSDCNASYIQELKRKNAEIDDLKRKLLEAPYKQMESQRTDDSEPEEPKIRTKPRYKELREEITGKKETNLSTASGSSLLENAKRYVASVQTAVRLPISTAKNPTLSDIPKP